MPKIFISYRHQDSSGYTGRISDRLSAEFGREQLFLDVDTIANSVRLRSRAVGCAPG